MQNDQSILYFALGVALTSKTEAAPTVMSFPTPVTYSFYKTPPSPLPFNHHPSCPIPCYTFLIPLRFHSVPTAYHTRSIPRNKHDLYGRKPTTLLASHTHAPQEGQSLRSRDPKHLPPPRRRAPTQRHRAQKSKQRHQP
jgi:hypothetical protein